MIEQVSLDGRAEMPWRNRCGSTRELLVWPPGHVGAWDLRVSVAEVAADADFSAWPGVQRQMVLLSGSLLLRWPDHSRLLAAGDAPLGFDGDRPPRAELTTPRAQVLNLMVGGSAGQAALLSAPADQERRCQARWRGLYSMDAARLQVDDHDAARLPAHSLAWSDHGDGQRWRVLPQDDGAALRAWWLELATLPPEAA